MSKKNIIIIIVVVCLIIAVAAVAYFVFRIQPKPGPEVELTPEQVINQTIEGFNSEDPLSFHDVQNIVDLGEAAIDPLAKLALSDDDTTQWAVVTGLTSIRRTMEDPTKVSSVIETMYDSKYLSIQVLAASSNAEYKNYSGVPILISALESDEIMSYMDPPQPVSRFANRALEFATGQDFSFDQAQTQAEKQAAIKKWQDWWQENKPEN
jgi:hypothetical protein